MPPAKTSYVCLPCRASYKLGYGGGAVPVCPRCARAMIHVGSAFAAPRRRDERAWRTLAVLLNAGVGFHTSCCCGCGPGYRPRSLREVRQRLRYARRTGTPTAEALVQQDLL